MLNPWGMRPPSMAAGIFAWFGMRVPFAERMALVRAAGFETVGLWWEEDDLERRRLRDHMPGVVRAAGLSICNLHAPYRGCAQLWSADAAARSEAVRRHLRWICDCQRHRIPALVMHAVEGKGTPPPGPAGRDSFRRLTERAEALGVILAVENTRSDAHLDYLFEAIDSPCLGFCYDTAHAALYSKGPGLLDRWTHRLAATHLCDTNGRRDCHWLLGDGVIDFDDIAQRLRCSGYRGPLMLECVCPRGETCPESFLKQARNRLKEFEMAVGGGAEVRRAASG